MVACLILLAGARETVVDMQTTRLRFLVALLEACLAITVLMGALMLTDAEILMLGALVSSAF